MRSSRALVAIPFGAADHAGIREVLEAFPRVGVRVCPSSFLRGRIARLNARRRHARFARLPWRRRHLSERERGEEKQRNESDGNGFAWHRVTPKAK